MPIRVYIADDHAVVRDGLRALLAVRPEISVVGDGASGRQAVGDLQVLHPDVVLMDISMPDMNGIEATRQILAVLPETRVIILSMLGTSEHVFQALRAGAQGYLLKDSAGREVVEAVLAVSAGKRYFSQPVADALIQGFPYGDEQAGEKSPLERLSPREREILQLVIDGKSSAEIGKLLSLSPKTVESYRGRLMQKLGISDLTGLIKFAFQNGLIALN
jgi:DNA-binding NarL/FixJ family response regulator